MGFWGSGRGWPRLLRRWTADILVFCLTFSSVAWAGLAMPVRADASDPNVLVVTKTSSGRVLLGGQTTFHVSVTNPNSYKVYNISLQDVVSSSRPNPQGRVAFISASDSGGGVAPTSVRTDAVGSGDTTLTCANIRDLAPGETYDLDLTFSVDPAKTGDPSWAINDNVLNSVVATGNQWPDGLGPVVPASSVASATAKLIPITITKTTEQSTAIAQATGTEGRQFDYRLVVQNNYTTQTASVVATDTLPDGVEYLGMVSGAAPDVVAGPDAATGKTTLQWNLGTLAPGASRTLVVRTGIRYDYYGTDNGGLNRPTASFVTTHGAIVPHGTTFANGAALRGIFATSTVVTDASTSTVTAAYFTGTKSSSPGNGGPGTVITHSLTYYTSQYYSAIDSGSVDATAGSSIIVHDHLPDGQTIETLTASVPPDSVTHNVDGTTDIYWKRPALANTSQQTITFDAVVDETWENAPLTGQPIRAGDSMTNNADFTAIWQDLIDANHTGNLRTVVAAAAAADFTTPKPKIVKRVRDLSTGAWSTTTSATVGDVLHFRVQFNASDTVKPVETQITKGFIEVTDWMPPGMSYVPGSATTTYSASGDFSTSSTRTIDLTTPTALTIGGLNGIQWFLGDVAKPGWWEAEFDAVVTNAAAVTAGGTGDNMWKLTGINSFGQTYSERDIVTVKYGEPVLGATKTVVTPSPLKPGDACTYTVTLTNTGSAAAEDLVVTDTIPPGMRNTPPSIQSVTVGGVPRTNPGSWEETYSASTGLWVVDFNDPAAVPAVETTIPPGKAMVITYRSSVDTTSGLDRQMQDTVTAGYGSSDTTVTRPYTPVSANASIRLPDATVTKLAAPSTATIGDTVTYRIRSTIPAGGVAWWPRIDDTIFARGFVYVPGSSRLETVSGSPAVPAAFAAGVSDPTTTTFIVNREVFSWLLDDPIDNRGSASPYVFDLYFDMRYSGDSSGTALFLPPALIPAAHNSVNDNGTLLWNDTTATTRPGAPNQNAASANVPTVIDQPWLVVTKANLDATSPVGGSAVPYRVTVANRGYATAHDILWTDVMPLGMRDSTPTLTSVKLNGTTITPPAYVDPTWDSTTGSYTIDFYDGGATNTSLSSGSTFTVDLTAYANQQPGAGTTLVNTATVSWNTTTTPAIGRFYPMSLAPAPNTGVATATVAVPTIQKYSVETSTQPGYPTEYRFRVTIPTETVVTDLEILDQWSTDGFGNHTTPVSVDITGSPLTGAVLDPSVAGDVNTAPSPGSTFLFRYHPSPGTASIVNADGASSAGDTAYVFELRYKVGPANYANLIGSGAWIWNPTTTGTITDRATLSWALGAGRATALSNTVSLPVYQPVIRTAKVPSISSVKGGDVVTFTVTATNIGNGTAYEYDLGPSLTDTLPTGLINPSFVSATHSANGLLADPADYSVTTAGGVIKVTFNEPASDKAVLAPGQSITYVYTAQVDPSIGAGTTLTNTADADWSSAFGYDAAWTSDLQYDDSNPLDPTTDTTTAVLTVPGSTVVKAVGGAVTTATIGATFSYGVTVTVPANTTLYNTVVSDFVPDGLTVLGASALPGTGTVSVGAKLGNGRTPVTWTVGDVSNPPTSTLTLTLQVSVDNTYTASGQLLDGLPASVDGDAQDSIVNTAGVAWDTAKSGGTGKSAVTAPVSVAVVEPHLIETKAASVATAVAGQNVTYTISVGNNGTSAAYNVAWSDLFDSWMVGAGSPALVSASVAGTPITSGTDFTASLPGANPFTLAFLGTTAIPVGTTMTVVCAATVDPGVANNRSMVNTATVASYRGLPGAGRLSAGPSATATVTAKAPGLVTSKAVVGDTFVQAGQLVQYRYTVRNVGEASATAVSFADAFPATDFTYEPLSAQVVWPSGSAAAEPAFGVGTVSWSTGSEIPNVVLGPSQTATLTFSMRVAGVPLLGSKTDTATATALDVAGTPVPASSGIPADTDPLDRSTAVVTVTRPHLAIDKKLAVGQDAFVPLGGSLAYAIRITNDGDTTMTTVPLSDSFDASRLAFVSAAPSENASGSGTLSWTDVTGAGVLAPGAATTVTVNFRVIAAGTAVPDTATVSAALDVNGDTPPVVSDTDVSATLTRPHVAIAKVLTSPAVGSVGGLVTYAIGITNDGDTVLASVPVTDTFDAARLRFTSASPAQDTTGTGSAHWNDVTGAGNLAVGQTTTITVSFTAIATGTAVPDTATVSAAIDVNGDTPPAVSATEKTLTLLMPGVTVDKHLASGQDPIVALGGTVDYEIVARNSGETTLTTVPLSDTFDATRLALVSAAPSADSTGSGTLAWTDLTGAGSLAPGATTTVTVRFSVIATGSSVTDTATIAGAVDVNGVVPPTATDPDKVLTATRPHLKVTKRLSGFQDPWVPLGHTVSYDLVVTNDGETTMTAIPVIDKYDARLAFVSSVPSPAATGTLSVGWDAGSLVPGASTTITATFRVVSPGISIPDTVTVAGAVDVNGDTPPTVFDTDRALTGTNPLLAITKRLSAGQDAIVAIGNTVTYDIGIRNTGDTTMTTIPLADDFDAAHLAFVSASPTSSASATSSVAWADVTGVGVLGVGQTTTVTATFRVTAAGASIPDTATVAGATDVNGDTPPTVFDTDRTLTGTNPLLAITKRLSAGQDPIVAIGNTVTYDIGIRNTGDTTMTTVPLSDDFDAAHLAFVSASPTSSAPSTSSVAWADVTGAGVLGVGQTTTVTVTFRVTAAGSSITDTATVAGATDVNGDTPRTVSDHDSTLLGTRPHLSVTKLLAAGQPVSVPLGHDVSYVIRVVNDGDTTMTTVPLTDTYDATQLDLASAVPTAAVGAPGTLTWADLTGAGSLAPGAATTVTLTFTALKPARPTIDVAAIAGAIDVNGDTPPVAADTNNAAILTRPSVAIDKRLAPGQHAVVPTGSDVTYRITVTNDGDTTLTAVPLTDDFDAAHLTFVSSTPPVDSTATGTLAWTDLTGSGALAPSAAISGDVTFRVTAAGAAITDTATVSGSVDEFGDNPVPATAADDVLGAFAPGSITLSKSATPSSGVVVLPGDTVTYTITYVNSSPTTITAASVVDTLSPAIAFQPGSITLAGVAQTDATGDDSAGYDSAGRRILANLGDVPPHSQGTLVFRVTVGAEEISRAGFFNAATLGGPDIGSIDATPTFHPVDPFDISKTARDVNGGKLRPGDVLEWTITVTNTGLTQTTHVRITDSVPAGTTYVAGSITGPGADDSGNPHLAWDVGSMDVSQTVVATFRTRLGSKLPNNYRILNVAMVTSDQSRAKLSDNPATPGVYDPTVAFVRTSGDEATWLALALLALFGAAVLTYFALRRPRARRAA